MDIIALILLWAGDFQAFPPSDFQKACEAAQLHPGAKVESVLKDYSRKPLECKKVPEKKIVTTIPAYWTAY